MSSMHYSIFDQDDDLMDCDSSGGCDGGGCSHGDCSNYKTYWSAVS